MKLLTPRSEPQDQQHSERGVITSMFAVLAVFFFLIISVVAEGGRKLGNLSRAEDVAAEAARAAAATLDVDRLGQGQAFIAGADEDGRARLAALDIVTRVPGASIERFDIGEPPTTVLVVVRISQSSVLPGLNIDGVGSHRATALNPFG